MINVHLRGNNLENVHDVLSNKIVDIFYFEVIFAMNFWVILKLRVLNVGCIKMHRKKLKTATTHKRRCLAFFVCLHLILMAV